MCGEGREDPGGEGLGVGNGISGEGNEVGAKDCFDGIGNTGSGVLRGGRFGAISSPCS